MKLRRASRAKISNRLKGSERNKYQPKRAEGSPAWRRKRAKG